MEMHKIEVYTLRQELAQVIGNLPANAQLVGALDVHYRQRHRQEESKAVTADTRVEIFTDSNPSEIIAHLSTVETVLDIQAYPCKQLFSGNNANKQDVATSSPATVVPEKRAGAPANCRLSMVSESSLRLSIDASMSQAFLWKIFHVLCAMELSITGGRKYRQGEKDFVTFTSTTSTLGNSQPLQDAIRSIFEHGDPPEPTFHNETASSCDTIDIRLDASSNLPALIIRATGNSAVIRNSLQKIFCTEKLDTIIARFTSRENGIEDIYYLKQLGDTAVTDSLARTIEQTIQGE